MDELKIDYPGYLSRANAKHAELSAALGKKKPKKAGSRKSTRSEKGKGKEKEKEEKDKVGEVDEGSHEEGSEATDASRSSHSPISGDTLWNPGK